MQIKESEAVENCVEARGLRLRQVTAATVMEKDTPHGISSPSLLAISTAAYWCSQPCTQSCQQLLLSPAVQKKKEKK